MLEIIGGAEIPNCKFLGCPMLSLCNVMRIIERCEYSTSCLELILLESSHKKLGVVMCELILLEFSHKKLGVVMCDLCGFECPTVALAPY